MSWPRLAPEHWTKDDVMAALVELRLAELERLARLTLSLSEIGPLQAQDQHAVYTLVRVRISEDNWLTAVQSLDVETLAMIRNEFHAKMEALSKK